MRRPWLSVRQAAASALPAHDLVVFRTRFQGDVGCGPLNCDADELKQTVNRGLLAD